MRRQRWVLLVGTIVVKTKSVKKFKFIKETFMEQKQIGSPFSDSQRKQILREYEFMVNTPSRWTWVKSIKDKRQQCVGTLGFGGLTKKDGSQVSEFKVREDRLEYHFDETCRNDIFECHIKLRHTVVTTTWINTVCT